MLWEAAQLSFGYTIEIVQGTRTPICVEIPVEKYTIPNATTTLALHLRHGIFTQPQPQVLFVSAMRLCTYSLSQPWMIPLSAIPPHVHKHHYPRCADSSPLHVGESSGLATVKSALTQPKKDRIIRHVRRVTAALNRVTCVGPGEI